MHCIALSGSLRKDSYNTKLIYALQGIAPEGMTIELAEIGTLPLFNADFEAAYPAVAQALKEKIKAADGIIITTPEYNRSISGVLKNAIDWISRPYGTNAFDGKPVLITGVSTGNIGTAIAQSHLKEIMLYLNARLAGQPELYFGNAKDLFMENGDFAQESARTLVRRALETFSSPTLRPGISQ